MAQLIKTMTIVALIASSGPLLAQETTPAPEAPTAPETAPAAPEAPAEAPEAETPATEATAPEAPANDADRVGSTYISETHGDWSVRCVRTAEGKDPCQLYQLLNDGNGNSVAEISMFGLPQGREVAAGATIITPLETLLTQQLAMSVDTGQVKKYPFTFCAANGCFARIGFTAPEVNQFKRGANAKLVIVPAAAPDQQIELTVSLKGFTAGYDAVNAANGN